MGHARQHLEDCELRVMWTVETQLKRFHGGTIFASGLETIFIIHSNTFFIIHWANFLVERFKDNLILTVMWLLVTCMQVTMKKANGAGKKIQYQRKRTLANLL